MARRSGEEAADVDAGPVGPTSGPGLAFAQLPGLDGQHHRAQLLGQDLQQVVQRHQALQRPVDPSEWEAIWRDLLSYKAGRGNQAAPLGMADVLSYARRMIQRRVTPPAVSPLMIGNQ